MKFDLMSRENYIDNIFNLSIEDGVAHYKDKVLSNKEVVLIGDFSEEEISDISNKFGFCAVYKTKEDFSKHHKELK